MSPSLTDTRPPLRGRLLRIGVWISKIKPQRKPSHFVIRVARENRNFHERATPIISVERALRVLTNVRNVKYRISSVNCRTLNKTSYGRDRDISSVIFRSQEFCSPRKSVANEPCATLSPHDEAHTVFPRPPLAGAFTQKSNGSWVNISGACPAFSAIFGSFRGREYP
jgi:hypothetical protein